MEKKNDNRSIPIMVIIPVYNAQDYLAQAVESVFSQSYRNIKIILIDDGSTDGSAVLCDELADRNERITVIHQKNFGVSAARNTGLDYVFSVEKNENAYVAFLDADDAWRAGWLDVENVKLIEKNYDVIGFQSCNCNQFLTRRSAEISLQEGEFEGGSHSVWIHANHSICAILFRVGMIKQYDIRFQNIKASEDKIFLMQSLYLADKIYQKKQLMYFYRQNKTSIMHTRVKGISYYEPIIDAYLESDKTMLQWSNDVRGRLSEGRLLAKIYLLDMIEEELECGDGATKIIELFERRTDYQKLLEESSSSLNCNSRWEDITKNKKKIIKNRIRGILFVYAKKIYNIPLVKACIDRKRYPIKVKV